MQCQECKTDIPSGELFCPRCGKEVQLVPDYNSVEYMIQQKQAEEELRLRKEQEHQKRIAKQQKKAAEARRRKKKTILAFTILVLMLMAVITVAVIFYVRYKQENSFDYQYGLAYEAYQAEDYVTAGQYGQKALTLSPNNDNAILLMAEVKIKSNDIEGGIALLMQYIEKYPDAVDAYARIITIYDEQGADDKICALLDACNNDIVLTEFAAYIPSDVQFMTEPGAYTEKIIVELEYKNGTVYYTTDGTDPDSNSAIYTEPIMLEEGMTMIKAVSYSDAGIAGDVVCGEYTITLAIPDPPFISPASGEYGPDDFITVIVPDGCKAYYAFDSIAGPSSKLYTEPVAMMDGEHIFSAIIVDKNGKQSYPASETYVVVEE